MKQGACTIVCVMAFGAVVGAQGAPAPAVDPAAVSIPLGTRVGLSVSGYDDGGRRDPFTALVAPKRVTGADGVTLRPRSGLAGIALNDVTVSGIVRNGSTMLAILETSTKQSYVARANDRLLDASVAHIDAGGVTFAPAEGAGGVPVRKNLRAAAVAGEAVR
ncbi:MAG TPA: hypothetical protein VHD57_14285 [Vicinamibacterales bacterium]|nr:hypothetical protein [Vicinamibacterales bacterium]